MRIPNSYIKHNGATPADGANTGNGFATPIKDAGHAAPTNTASTNVTLSSRARQLSANADPKAPRISALRDQYQRGELRVDARAIAAKLIGDDR